MTGPVQVLVVGYDEPSFTGEAWAELTRLRQAGVVRLVDLLLVSRDADGTFRTLPPPEGAAPDLGRIAADILGQGSGGAGGDDDGEGTASSDDGSWSLADALEPGGVAAVVLIEHLWAGPLVDAIRGSGGRALAEAWLSPEDRARLPVDPADEVWSDGRMSADDELRAMARRVIDANRYLVLGTLDPDGRPRLSPVFFTPARYRDLYWVSSPDAHHSQNLRDRPDVEVVVFDSSTQPNHGEAVYISATAREVPPAELPHVVEEAFDPETRGARAFTPEELSGDGDLRLYVATATSYDVHVRASHPTHGTGIDRRVATDPTDQLQEPAVPGHVEPVAEQTTPVTRDSR